MRALITGIKSSILPRPLGVLVALLALIAADAAYGLSKQARSKVYGILTGDSYSGCMVQIGRIPSDSGLNCPDKERTWLTFDCHGNRMARSEADRNLKVAQMAILTGDKITVTIDDSFKASGWCLGKQVILFR